MKLLLFFFLTGRGNTVLFLDTIMVIWTCNMVFQFFFGNASW